MEGSRFSEGDDTVTSELFPPIPTDTTKVVRAIFGSSNFYVATGDQVNQLFNGLIPSNSKKSSQNPARIQAELYLITIFQYLETLPDSQAADAVRQRRDWKYALHLPLNATGFQPSAFCDFRKCLLVDQPGLQTLQTLLARLADLRPATNGEQTSLEAGHIVIRVCLFSRLSDTWEAIVQALEILAARHPGWLRSHALPHWYERYGYKHQPINFAGDRQELEVLTRAIGSDGTYLLKAISESEDQSLQGLPEVLSLKQVWQEQYHIVDGKAVWREDLCAGCAVST